MESLPEGRLPVRIHLTGRLTVASGTGLLTSADFAGPQVALVVAVLAVNHHRPMSPVELAEIVWAGQAPESWRSTVRGHVSRARSALREVGVVLAGGDGWYQLELPKNSTVDVVEAEKEVHLAEAAARLGDSVTAGRSAAVVAMIASEPVLPELDHPWIDNQRRLMLGYRVRTLEVLVELWLESEHFSQALVDAGRLVDLDPLRETGHEALIRAHIGAGNQVLALRAYENCRSVLLEEVGASPGPAIQALYKRLLAS